MAPRSRIRGTLWRLAVATALVAVMLGGARGLSAWASEVVGSTLSFASEPLVPTIEELDTLAASTRVVARDGAVLHELSDAEHRKPVSLDELPDHVTHAVLAAEDAHFFEHAGFDLQAIARAGLRTLQGHVQGGSTITQQLAKLNYTDSDRTITRKVQELVYAARLEDEFSKEELLERYVNQVYFGDRAYGIEAAAQSYFGVPARELRPSQSAMLAAMIRAPEQLDPRERPDGVRDRRNQVLDAMEEHGWTAPEESERARAEPLELAPPPERDAVAPHFVEYVKREALALDELGPTVEARRQALFTGGYTIETTLDLEAYRAAEEAVTGQLDEPGDPASAVVSVVPGNGAIRVLFGGRDFGDQKFDVATQARRQPGSAFKPFVYLAMLRDGIHPASTFDSSSPRTFDFDGKEFEVSNYSRHGYGPLDADGALIRSVNTVFMDIGLEVGPEAVVDAAGDAGIDGELLPVPAASLGGIDPGVSPLEMATAYATFASGGVEAEPYAIARIRDRSGSVVYEANPDRERAFEPEEVGILNETLLEVVRRGTGRAAALDRPVAGKTGTTSEYRDAWFVGYVPQLATAVWNGHLDNSPMRSVHGRRVTGGSFPARIFHDAMSEILEGVEPLPLPGASPDELDLEVLHKWSPPTTTSTTTTSSTTSTTAPDSSTTSTSSSSTTSSSSSTSTSSTSSTTTTTGQDASQTE